MGQIGQHGRQVWTNLRSRHKPARRVP